MLVAPHSPLVSKAASSRNKKIIIAAAGDDDDDSNIVAAPALSSSSSCCGPPPPPSRSTEKRDDGSDAPNDDDDETTTAQEDFPLLRTSFGSLHHGSLMGDTPFLPSKRVSDEGGASINDDCVSHTRSLYTPSHPAEDFCSDRYVRESMIGTSPQFGLGWASPSPTKDGSAATTDDYKSHSPAGSPTPSTPSEGRKKTRLSPNIPPPVGLWPHPPNNFPPPGYPRGSAGMPPYPQHPPQPGMYPSSSYYGPPPYYPPYPGYPGPPPPPMSSSSNSRMHPYPPPPGFWPPPMMHSHSGKPPPRHGGGRMGGMMGPRPLTDTKATKLNKRTKPSSDAAKPSPSANKKMEKSGDNKGLERLDDKEKEEISKAIEALKKHEAEANEGAPLEISYQLNRTSSGRWQVMGRILSSGQTWSLGVYDTKDKAILARNWTRQKLRPPSSHDADARAHAQALLRGVTVRPSGKWQAQIYAAGASRYIGIFDSREKAALAYEMVRKQLKTNVSSQDAALLRADRKLADEKFKTARKAAMAVVHERFP